MELTYQKIRINVTAIVLLFSLSPAYSIDNEKESYYNNQLKGSRYQLRDFNSKKSIASEEGRDRFLRYSVHDGNLITGGITNSGLISHHYVSGNPTISWPKGPKKISYIHGTVFFVAAEVVDTNGDTVHIVSDNYRRSSAETSDDLSHFYAFMPVPKYFNMDQPEAYETPEMYGISEDVGEDGIPNTFDIGEGDGLLQSAEDFNGNSILDLSMQNKVGWFAISHRKETWPEYWPPQTYPGDDREIEEERPGVRAGRWNGEYGAYMRADQESYYSMDDRENDEFEYYPIEGDTQGFPDGRRGLGLKVDVRSYQWSARLAEDIFISIYDITNEGKDLNKCIVGMYVDPDMGGSLSGDDADFDNLADITYAWNRTGIANNGLPTGYFGFGFFESPGLANDGIDNDEDGIIDESQNNGLDDDGDWLAWEDENGNGIWDSEDLNYNLELDAGEDQNENGILDIEPLNDDLGADGLGPNYDGYTGPDIGEANGIPDIGEPNFEFTDNDESDQVGLTSWYLRDVDNTMADDEQYWDVEIQPGNYTIRPGYQRDIAWTYGSGFVEFAGDEKTHRYAIALLFGNDQDDILRNKRTMQVIYDKDYSFAKPPRTPIVKATAYNNRVILSWDKNAENSRDPIYGRDFEAYYVYKSSDPSFTEIKTITDAYGNPLLFKPEAIYDKINGLGGIHPVNIGGEMGTESDLGVSYNMGTDSGLKHFYVDSSVTNGRTYYYAIVSVDRGHHSSFYPSLTDLQEISDISPTECSASIQVDPLGRTIGFDRNTIAVTPEETPAGWVEPNIQIDRISGVGTGTIEVKINNPNGIKDGYKYSLEFDDDGSFEQYDSTHLTGLTSQMTLYSITDDELLGTVADPNSNILAEEFIYDGIHVILHNDGTGLKETKWTQGESSLTAYDITGDFGGLQIGRDYEIRVYDVGADTSVLSLPVVTNFQIWDVTNPEDEYQVDYMYTPIVWPTDPTRPYLKENDQIKIINNIEDQVFLWQWLFLYPDNADSASKTLPQNGDVYSITTIKPFDRNDIFEITVFGNYISSTLAKNEMNDIYVVPDPYVSVNPLERKVINQDEGRGDRRIDFVNLPQDCKIYIFTVSGKLVRQLNHLTTENNSRESWDLRTKDGLEISHGIYFYVVESPEFGTKRGRFAVIK
ncbi:MAG: hypothetical protein QF852_08510 [Candidatus Marinimicrobia bacterium]|jgi:hypothetical protein|nr:hypothetical protein [Candidatus Neomarinimicrobiota bacterium]HJL74831.1 hypothetical protein [Candidatus Neomarinimicrobiota bacterium]|tara:strand:- start:10349 stop:13795 length:3447 start_codon:yes stop_codon:yes gene_type:complete